MADKYINATKALKALKVTIADSGEELPLMEEIIEKLFEALPAADVVEVKHGYWKVLVFKGGRKSGQAEAKCSVCGRDAVYQIVGDKWEFENFCPHCGVKMRGESNEREA